MTINNNARLFKSGNWNENNLNPLARNHWRASLVPAAAVIPAPIAYIKIVAVILKLLVKSADCEDHLLCSIYSSTSSETCVLCNSFSYLLYRFHYYNLSIYFAFALTTDVLILFVHDLHHHQ